jgi:hypothetical protein
MLACWWNIRGGGIADSSEQIAASKRTEVVPSRREGDDWLPRSLRSEPQTARLSGRDDGLTEEEKRVGGVRA